MSIASRRLPLEYDCFSCHVIPTWGQVGVAVRWLVQRVLMSGVITRRTCPGGVCWMASDIASARAVTLGRWLLVKTMMAICRFRRLTWLGMFWSDVMKVSKPAASAAAMRSPFWWVCHPICAAVSTSCSGKCRRMVAGVQWSSITLMLWVLPRLLGTSCSGLDPRICPSPERCAGALGSPVLSKPRRGRR